MMNSYLLNPAVAGHEGYTSLNLTVREQWIGLKDAPSTYAFSAQTRLLTEQFYFTFVQYPQAPKNRLTVGQGGHGRLCFYRFQRCL